MAFKGHEVSREQPGVQTSGDMGGRGGRGHVLPGPPGCLCSVPIQSSLFRLQKGNEAQRRGGPVLGCQAQGQDSGWGVTWFRSPSWLFPARPPRDERHLQPHPRSRGCAGCSPVAGGGRRALCACPGRPCPRRARPEGDAAEGDAHTQPVSVISPDTQARGPVLSCSVPGGGDVVGTTEDSPVPWSVGCTRADRPQV